MIEKCLLQQVMIQTAELPTSKRVPEISTFQSLDLEHMLMYQKTFKMQKCYLSLN